MTTETKEQHDVRTPAASEGEARTLEQVHMRPVADVYRDKDAVRLHLDVPGARDQDVEVEVHDGVLGILARVERSEGQLRVYERTFRLDRRMDVGAIEANLRRGVLEIRVPYHEEARPRRIEVKAG